MIFTISVICCFLIREPDLNPMRKQFVIHCPTGGYPFPICYSLQCSPLGKRVDDIFLPVFYITPHSTMEDSQQVGRYHDSLLKREMLLWIIIIIFKVSVELGQVEYTHSENKNKL